MSRLSFVMAAALVAGSALCAPFMDPTRPPTAAEAMGLPAGAQSAARVESILIAPDRRIAVINGEPVMLGGRTAAGEVVRITESEVVVRGADGEQTLKLFPSVAGRAPLPQGRTPQ